MRLPKIVLAGTAALALSLSLGACSMSVNGSGSGDSGSPAARVATGVALMLLASASVYIPGLIWLKVATGAGWGTTLYLGLVPFIVGDILKSVVATGLLPARSRLR